MKTINKICISFAICMLALIAGAGVAHAGEVTVNYQVIPDGPILSNNVVTSCTPETADTYTGYQFEFWDNQGTISWNTAVTVCPGSGNTVATAWYVATGGGKCPKTGCFVTTYAFSIDHGVFLTDGTAIALVNPNAPPKPAWTTPSTTVNTRGPESISAESALAFHLMRPSRSGTGSSWARPRKRRSGWSLTRPKKIQRTSSHSTDPTLARTSAMNWRAA